mgnify:CR=1 FL=1
MMVNGDGGLYLGLPHLNFSKAIQYNWFYFNMLWHIALWVIFIWFFMDKILITNEQSRLSQNRLLGMIYFSI